MDSSGILQQPGGQNQTDQSAGHTVNLENTLMDALCTDLYMRRDAAACFVIKRLIFIKVSFGINIALASPTVPLWSSCFSLLSLTFLHLKIESTDGQIALFLHHLLLTQIYFGIMSTAKGAGSFCWWRSSQFFSLHMVFRACMPASYTSCECALMWVCAVYHDGECSIASVMLVERGH